MLFIPAEVAAVTWGWEGGKLVCIKWIKKGSTLEIRSFL